MVSENISSERIKKEGIKMGLLTFKGGLHPYDGKELTRDGQVVEYNPKGNAVFMEKVR